MAWHMRKGIRTTERFRPVPQRIQNSNPTHPMNNIVYIIGAVVVIVVVLKVLGLF